MNELIVDPSKIQIPLDRDDVIKRYLNDPSWGSAKPKINDSHRFAQVVKDNRSLRSSGSANDMAHSYLSRVFGKDSFNQNYGSDSYWAHMIMIGSKIPPFKIGIFGMSDLGFCKDDVENLRIRDVIDRIAKMGLERCPAEFAAMLLLDGNNIRLSDGVSNDDVLELPDRQVQRQILPWGSKMVLFTDPIVTEGYPKSFALSGEKDFTALTAAHMDPSVYLIEIFVDQDIFFSDSAVPDSRAKRMMKKDQFSFLCRIPDGLSHSNNPSILSNQYDAIATGQTGLFHLLSAPTDSVGVFDTNVKEAVLV